MTREGPETKLVRKMREAGAAKYGSQLVMVKYHGSQFGETGVSDLLCVLNGVFVAVEVKAPESYGGSVEKALEKGPTVKQRLFGKRVEKAGGVFDVCATIDGFLETLFAAERMSWDDEERATWEASQRPVEPVVWGPEFMDYVKSRDYRDDASTHA
jgi:hypothetical protein